MSGHCTALVLDQYPGGGADFKLALAIADGADDEGYAQIEATLRLLHLARLTEVGFSRALDRMKKKGWLTVIDASECLYRLGPPARAAASNRPKLSLVV